MGFFDRWRTPAPAAQPEERRRRRRGLQPGGRRAYAAGTLSRLSASFPGVFGTADAEIQASLFRARARSRQLAQDSDVIKRFFHLVNQNVIGSEGIALKMRARDPVTGKLDQDANKRISDRWYDFVEARNFTTGGQLHGIEASELALRTAARDGETFTRTVSGFDNPHRFAVQLVEADFVDEQYSKRISADRLVRMGVEIDGWDRPLAYYLRPRHPGDPFGSFDQGASAYERVPASELLHLYIQERPTQSRGFPWTHTAATRVDMADGYLEAELVAARTSASKMGFYQLPAGEEYQGDDEDDEGRPIQEAEPGTFETLPHGWEFKDFDPQHPAGAFEPFMRMLTRRLSAGLNLSYHQLGNDGDGLTFSGGRMFELSDRDFYRALQGWFSRRWLDQIFARWLRVQIDGGLLPLPSRKLETFIAGARWQGRGWAYTDPAKEVKGHRESYELRVTSLTRIALGLGVDLEDVFDEIAEENARMKELGIEPPAAKPAAAPGTPPAAPEDDDDETDDDDDEGATP